MNELDLIRTMRADLPELGRAAEAAARAELLAQAAQVEDPARARWRVPALRLGAGLVAAAAATTAVLVGLPGDGGTRFANAAMEIEGSGAGWEIRIKDGGADPAVYREALEGVGLDSDFRFVAALTPAAAPSAPPEAPAEEGEPPTEIRIHDEGTPGDLLDLTITIAGKGPGAVDLGDGLATAPGPEDSGATRLRGLAVAEAVERLDGLGLKAAFASGRLADDGTGTIEIPGRPWKPSDTAKVSGAYLSSDHEVTLVVEEELK
ncbi:hypothetical protein EDD29_7675 [Actinocorallia herbida]|uniref:Uncharacterized protein n=1 Tax=Actinocorallia herbida TaxID=58109 RepID=A0A3N1D8V1_9ACTN|nr:hypothetical protein [Actinocorallia herbida]ROO89963.1 hypothetical protein EDD29_7675 [Actinocorallia herbida]